MLEHSLFKKVISKASLKKYIPAAIKCSKLTIETLEQGVKYLQS